MLTGYDMIEGLGVKCHRISDRMQYNYSTTILLAVSQDDKNMKQQAFTMREINSSTLQTILLMGTQMQSMPKKTPKCNFFILNLYRSLKKRNMEANNMPVMTRNTLAPLIVGAEKVSVTVTVHCSRVVELLRKSMTKLV